MENIKTLVCFLAATAFLAACTPSHTVEGNLLQDYQIAEIKPGVDTQTDVLRKLGSPTTKAPFDDNVWYYMGQEVEKKGVLDPKIMNERVYVVFFDSAGTLVDAQTVDNQRHDLPLVRRKTPTSGNEVTVLQQLLGNLGKFNKEEESGPGI